METTGFVATYADLTAQPELVIAGGVLLDDTVASAIKNCLGAISLAPNSPPTDTLAHSTSEVMFVAQGVGRLLTEEGTFPLSPGTAIFIPAEAWHSLQNTGDTPLISVFSFPTPNRPETWSKN